MRKLLLIAMVAFASLTMASTTLADAPGSAVIWDSSWFAQLASGEQTHLHVMTGTEPWYGRYKHWLKVDLNGGRWDEYYYVSDMLCNGSLLPGQLSVDNWASKYEAYTWLIDTKPDGHWSITFTRWFYHPEQSGADGS
jgi:hypothetical protein